MPLKIKRLWRTSIRKEKLQICRKVKQKAFMMGLITIPRKRREAEKDAKFNDM